MKLNNKGWGTMEMLLLCGGLLIALLVSVFFISKLYSSFGKPVINNYVELEAKLVDAGKKYIADNAIEVKDTFKVNSEILKIDGYLKELKDSNGNECTGYVRANNENGIIKYYGFVKCQGYTTDNY